MYIYIVCIMDCNESELGLLAFSICREPCIYQAAPSCFQPHPSLPACLSRNEERSPNYEAYPSTDFSPCVSSVPTSLPWTHWIPFISTDVCSLLSYIRRCTVKNSPLRKLQKSCFLYYKAVFSSYVFHKYSLSLITA